MPLKAAELYLFECKVAVSDTTVLGEIWSKFLSGSASNNDSLTTTYKNEHP